MEKKIVAIICSIILIVSILYLLYIVQYCIRRKLYTPSNTAVYLMLFFVFLLILSLGLYGIYMKKGFFFNGCMIFSLILIIFTIFKTIKVLK